MKKILLIALATLVALGLTARAGDLTGTVTFKGTPPAEKSYEDAMQADPNCTALYSGAYPTTHFYAVSASGGLADVVVSLKGAGTSTGASAPPAMLDQKGCLYMPTIIAVQTGQKVIVRNSDPVMHNVHIVPKENEEKNMAQAPGAPDLEFVFDKPEPFLKFKCDVHPWMYAWVSVMDSPYYSVSDKDGKFTIKNVPPGTYTLEFAHRKLGTQTVQVVVTASGATQDFTFEAQ